MPHTPFALPPQHRPIRRYAPRALAWPALVLALVAAGAPEAWAARVPEVGDDDFGAPPAEAAAPRARYSSPPVKSAPPGRVLPRAVLPGRPAVARPPVRAMPVAPAARPQVPVARPPVRPPVSTPVHPAGALGTVAPARRPVPSSNDVEEIETAEVKTPASGAATWFGDGWPAWDRIVDAYTARTVRRRTFGTLISHRNFGAFYKKPFHSLLGFDAGQLKVGLGLRYGILDDLDVGLLRLNGTAEEFNTYEFDARYNIIAQQKYGVDLALRVGISWFEQDMVSDASGFFAQLLIDRVIANRLVLGGGLLMHTNSSGPEKSTTDKRYSAALQAYLDWRIYDGMSLFFEATPHILGYGYKTPVMAIGPRFITNRHTFTILMTNSQYTGADGIITGANKSLRKWMLGFNITREL